MPNPETAGRIFDAVDPEKIKTAAKEVADVASDFIKKHPLESVGAALALGLVVGLLINRK
jgi:ElaB/YqjD/DUF883 family membrane-anchored ribosome-binding protein